MNGNVNPATDQHLPTALAQMLEALRILDEAGAPGDIGSYLDLAIARLEELLGAGSRLDAAAERLIFDLTADASEGGEEPNLPSVADIAAAG